LLFAKQHLNHCNVRMLLQEAALRTSRDMTPQGVAITLLAYTTTELPGSAQGPVTNVVPMFSAKMKQQEVAVTARAISTFKLRIGEMEHALCSAVIWVGPNFSPALALQGQADLQWMHLQCQDSSLTAQAMIVEEWVVSPGLFHAVEHADSRHALMKV
jgi:hypothetical protein